MFTDNGGPSDRDQLHEAHKEIRRLQEALAAALASPPADDAAAVYRAVLEGAGYERLDDLPARGVEFARMLGETARMHTLALAVPQAPPASDPPGLVALARETRDIVDGYDDQLPSVKVAQGTPFAVAVGLMRRWLLAYPLPASPQAETKGDE